MLSGCCGRHSWWRSAWSVSILISHEVLRRKVTSSISRCADCCAWRDRASSSGIRASAAAYGYSLGFTLVRRCARLHTRVGRHASRKSLDRCHLCGGGSGRILLIDRAPQGAEHLSRSSPAHRDQRASMSLSSLHRFISHCGAPRDLAPPARDRASVAWDSCSMRPSASWSPFRLRLPACCWLFSFLIIRRRSAFSTATTLARQLAIGWLAGAVNQCRRTGALVHGRPAHGATMVCAFGAALCDRGRALSRSVRRRAPHGARGGMALRWCAAIALAASALWLIAARAPTSRCLMPLNMCFLDCVRAI